MKIGNRHLQHKLSAMTEAAQKDTPSSAPASPAVNGKRVIINLDIFKESTDLQQCRCFVLFECCLDIEKINIEMTVELADKFC